MTDVNSYPINLTNYNISSQLKQSILSQNVDATLNVVTTNASTGLVQIKLDRANTSNLMAPYRYLFDIIIYNTTTNITYRALEGNVFVSPGISTYPASYPPLPTPDVNQANSANAAANNIGNLIT